MTRGKKLDIKLRINDSRPHGQRTSSCNHSKHIAETISQGEAERASKFNLWWEGFQAGCNHRECLERD